MGEPSAKPVRAVPGRSAADALLPKRCYLVVNEQSGAGSVPYEVFEGFTVVPVADAASVLESVTLDAETLVAVWGGDGTCRAVAELLMGTSATLLVCPGGTHNHFAHAANIASIDDVVSALRTHQTITVDVGMVGGKVFLNNANFGWYVDLVARRERYETRLPRRTAKMLSTVVQILRTHRSVVTIDGRSERVWMVWIGNGRYSLTPTELTERDDLSDGLLDVRVMRVASRLPKLRAFVHLISGHADSTPGFERSLTETCRLGFRKPLVRGALDGELVELENPLVVRCLRDRLRLAVPPAPAPG